MIYADYNATTPLGEGARTWIAQAFELWGNPSSSHRQGRKAMELLNKSREAIAELVGVTPNDIVFTSGGSEANHLALMGKALEVGKGFRILTSQVEHSSVKDLLPLIQKLGGEVDYISVNGQGQLSLSELEAKLKLFNPHLVSLMTANNETGVIFPIPDIAELCQKNSALFHTDAVQGLGKLDSAFYRSAHLVSISAHKIYGPKGVGALIIKKGTSLVATHYGGAQEIKRRGGTENILGIAGFAGAAQELMTSDSQTISPFIRDYFESTLQKNLEGIWVQGLKEPRIPNTSNIRFQGIPSEVLLGALDLEGIAISAGSACSSGSISPSHVLLNMGLNENEAKECVRFSWGKTSTLQAVEEVAQKVIAHVSRIRARNSTKVISN